MALTAKTLTTGVVSITSAGTTGSALTLLTRDTKDLIIKNIWLCNTSSSAVTVTMWLSSSNTAPTNNTTAANAIFCEYSIPAKDSQLVEASMVMDATYKYLYAKASSANVVNVYISGIEVG